MPEEFCFLLLELGLGIGYGLTPATLNRLVLEKPWLLPHILFCLVPFALTSPVPHFYKPQIFQLICIWMQSYSISPWLFGSVLVKIQMIFFLFRCSNLALTTSLVTHKSPLTRTEGTSTQITISSTSRTLASTTAWLTCTSTRGARLMSDLNRKSCQSIVDHFENLLQEQQHKVCDQTEPLLPQPGEHDIYGELIRQNYIHTRWNNTHYMHFLRWKENKPKRRLCSISNRQCCNSCWILFEGKNY